MKLLLAVFLIALVAQVCVADDEKTKAYETLKDIVVKLKPVVEAVVKDIPTTDAYQPYKEEWSNLLKSFDEKKEGDHCLNKSLKLVGEIGTLYVEYKESNASPEKKEMLNLFKKHGGVEVLNRYEDIREVDMPITEYPFEQC